MPFNVEKMLSELNFSQSTRTLDEVSDDLEHFMKMKVQYFVEDSKREAQAHEQGINDEPMPPLVYGKQMDQKLHKQYEHGVGMTTKRVTNTLLSFLRKPSKSTECQTITYEEFEKQFTDQIDMLENSLRSKNEEEKII